MNRIVTVGKAQQLYALLKEDLLLGKYSTGDKLPSIRDLADQYGLSKNTVNTVIAMLTNDGLVKIRDGMGTFVTNAPKRAQMIGVMIFDFEASMRVDTDILQHIQASITPDYYLSLVNTSNRFDIFLEGLTRLMEMGCAGYLIIPPKDDPESASVLERAKSLLAQRPTVFAIRGIEGIEADCYSMDLAHGIQRALEYLTTGGKSRTAVILHDSKKFIHEELSAYKKWHKQLGRAVDQSLLIPWNPDAGVLRREVERLLPRIDSLIAPDGALVPLQDLILQTGRRIPQELSIVGINDTVLSRLFNPPLTSITFPVERIGRHAVQKLIARIEGRESSVPALRNYQPELIIRST